MLKPSEYDFSSSNDDSKLDPPPTSAYLESLLQRIAANNQKTVESVKEDLLLASSYAAFAEQYRISFFDAYHLIQKEQGIQEYL